MESNENITAVLLAHIDELAGKLALVTKDRDMYKNLYQYTDKELKESEEKNEKLSEQIRTLNTENRELYEQIHPEVHG